jgi:hypothetical protein
MGEAHLSVSEQGIKRVGFVPSPGFEHRIEEIHGKELTTVLPIRSEQRRKLAYIF